jgi:hypothetical protein
VLADFLEVFGGLRHIYNQIRAIGVRAEAPDAARIGLFPPESVLELLRVCLLIHAGSDFA